jgi:geranyl diphosphate 2-C-methyltransferase
VLDDDSRDEVRAGWTVSLNMLDNGFPGAMFRAIWNNESTMYVDLRKLFEEHARVLAPGGRYGTITGCYNDVHGCQPSRSVSQIDRALHL